MFSSRPQNTLERELKNFMFHLLVELLVMNSVIEAFANICQTTSFHSCFVSHRYNRVPRLLHISQESFFFWINRIVTMLPVICLSAIICLLFMVSDMKEHLWKEKLVYVSLVYIKNKIQYPVCQDNWL